MAALQKRNESYRVLFVHHGKQHAFTIGNVSDEEAETKANQVEYLLLRLKQKLIELPSNMDVVTFMKFDGKVPEVKKQGKLTLGKLRDDYRKTCAPSLEATTLRGIDLHFKHLVRSLGERFPVLSLSMADLQRHADKRIKEKGKKEGSKLSPATVRKELISLRTAWNWGVSMKMLTGKFPSIGRVKLPKAAEKPPFMTMAEIKRAKGNWECLYLTASEIREFLSFVKERASQPFLYPMCCLAAYTGMRRSEMLRAVITDIGEDTITVREKKRAHDRTTTRRLPITPYLRVALDEWLNDHPGGHLFNQHEVERSKKSRTEPQPVTPDEANDHLDRTLKGSKWEVMHGFHCLRHSFISACASKGVDQRMVDAWAGHSTEEQRRRYRHLYPSTQQDAISRVFEAEATPRVGTLTTRRGR